MAKLGFTAVIVSILLIGWSTPVQAQTNFDAIRAQVQTQVQERQLHPPTPVATSSTTPSPNTGFWFFGAAQSSEPAEVEPLAKPTQPDAVLHRVVGDLVVVRRVSGQLYLSLGSH